MKRHQITEIWISNEAGMLAMSIHDMMAYCSEVWGLIQFNTLRPRQNGSHFADNIFKCIFLNENVSTAIKISLKFVPKGPINNIQALVQIMAWRRPGDKPLSEPMMVSLPMHICVARPQWVKDCLSRYGNFHYKDKMVVKPSYLYNGNSYTGGLTHLYWDRPLGPDSI